MSLSAEHKRGSEARGVVGLWREGVYGAVMRFGKGSKIDAAVSAESRHRDNVANRVAGNSDRGLVPSPLLTTGCRLAGERWALGQSAGLGLSEEDREENKRTRKKRRRRSRGRRRL